MKKLFLFATAAIALASCSDSEELVLSQAQQEAGRGEVAFSVYANRTTRAGKSGVMDITNLQNSDAGIGIFGYHTNNTLYDAQNSDPNFMYNQKVTWDGNSKWAYDPVKFWPNEFGENAVSNDIDYVSFFAYAPYVEFDPNSGVALVPEGGNASQTQWKNITAASRNGDKGDPLIRYMVDTNPSTSVDLMWGVAADGSFASANPATTVAENECFINLTKQAGVNQTINWRFHHALAKLDVQIIAASDVVTEGTEDYTPTADAISVDEFTRVYLRWIEFSGFAMSGALSLHSKAPQAHWLNYDGATELKSSVVRFNDGLLNGKEGIADNVNPNEVVLGALNPELIEEPTPAIGVGVDETTGEEITTGGWTAKNAGIPTDKYVNVFDGADEDHKSIFVIPTNEPLSINMLYDIETADSQLSKYLSDGVTLGTRISNEITKTLNDIKIQAGKAYSIKIVVGLETIKVHVKEVAEWENATGNNGAKIDMPYNPARRIVLGMEGAMILKNTNLTDETDLTSHKRTIYFIADKSYTDENGKTYLRLSSFGDDKTQHEYNDFYVWVEEGATVDNGIAFPTYHQNDEDKTKPGYLNTSGVKIGSYPTGGFEEVQFYTARPLEVGMTGTFIREVSLGTDENGKNIPGWTIGSFEVKESTSTDDPENTVLLVVQRRNSDGTLENPERFANVSKTELYVNAGKVTPKRGNSTFSSISGWYIVK